ncbi:MAG: hypothetical protein U1F76_03650 [Candidatus Competibacteraceae bacterium]
MYTLRFPFRLPEGQEIQAEERVFEIAQKQFRLVKNDNWNVLTIDGFQTENDAESFINRLWSGLMWVLLHLNLAPQATLELTTVTYAEDPDAAAENLSKCFGIQIEGPVDGLLDNSRPAVYLTNKRLRIITGGEARIIVKKPAESFFELLQEYFNFSEQALPLADSKLRVALDLYATYFSESSANARFLTLVMSLEALATGTTRPQPVLDLLKKWQDEVEKAKVSLTDDTECMAAMDSLCRELLFRRESSIRSQIRHLVFTTLRDSGQPDAEQTANTAVKVYDHRSTLVHDGKLDPQILGQAISDAKSIVERVLRARFVSLVQNPEAHHI